MKKTIFIESLSSKLAYPLRLTGKIAIWFVHGSVAWLTFSEYSRPRRMLQELLIRLKDTINTQPKLKMELIRILNHFPVLKAKLKRGGPYNFHILLNPRDKLTFQAQKIYDQLTYRFNTNTFSNASLPQMNNASAKLLKAKKLKMAIVTPFPPDRTGIADYVAELLPALLEIYDIDIISDNKNFSDESRYTLKKRNFFTKNHNSYDRIVYQVGNSHFHAQMISLIDEIPGIVVLHDFYLGQLVSWLQGSMSEYGQVWDESLLDEYGYSSIYQRLLYSNEWAMYTFPVNGSILRNAKAIIVHSEYAKSLVSKWYGSRFNDKIYLLPQGHRVIDTLPQHLEKDEFLICSFGHITKTKLIHKIISAWSVSSASKDENCRLLFVGLCGDDEYSLEIKNLVSTLPNVEITNFVDEAEYQRLLSHANMAIQLRSESRGETSRAVLDCMAYGVPTIVNANGSMAELPEECVFKLQDQFSDDELIKALDTLYTNYALRKTLSANAKAMIAQNHEPASVVQKMKNIVEEVYTKPTEQTLDDFCISYLTESSNPAEEQICQLARNLELDGRKKEIPSLYIDISVVAMHDFRTGIQRVVRSILVSLLKIPFETYKIIPVYLTDQNGYWHYRVAHKFMENLIPGLISREDTVIEPSGNDIFLGLDFYAGGVIEARESRIFNVWRKRGVNINFVVYDILPIQFPQFFPSISSVKHAEWLNVIAEISDNLICISKSVADEVTHHLSQSNQLPNVGFFHLGADVENSLPSVGLPENASFILEKIKNTPSFLMVGTVEPRKGHGQTLAAFEQLWAEEVVVNLIIIGKKGWDTESLCRKLRHHKQLNNHLFWLEGASDEFLEKIYATSTCLIAASEGEGFGLPLIEAVQHNLPIIARDISVFREVAREYAYYFANNNDPFILANTIGTWLELHKNENHPRSDNMPWLTWKESAEQLLKCILDTGEKNHE